MASATGRFPIYFFAPCLLRTLERKNERDFFSLDKERPKLPFFTAAFCYLSFDIKKNKVGKRERKKTTENIKLFQLLALITSLCKGANDH